RLVRQTVDQVEIDIRNARAAQTLDSARHHLERLDAVDRRLNLGIELLDAETRAVEAERAERRDHRIGQRARIALDRTLGIGQDVEAVADVLHDTGKIVGLERGWRAAAEMEMRD